MSDRIYSHRDLIVYQKSFAAGKRVFELSQTFPREEMYSLTDQVRRSSRSVSANIAEAWRKRRYQKHFCSTLNIAEAEAAETQVWIEYASAHGYIDDETASKASAYYEEILRMIVKMIHGSSNWCDLKSREAGKAGREGVRESESRYGIAHESPVIDQYALLSPSPDLPDSPSSAAESKDA
ncbi:four helix bundle protein [Rosistilla oblonga]|uniref:Four helix bundle protein n=1 Tax=Rosistilla oblonga TaxID=2527990 RepID=A0A518J1C0_9BACT|nr:four helix bundle protein [Rosistilla oblonga]QDV59143.1 hypothetical protein Mal33_51710 [Rosistilla oblonga]